MQLNGNSVVVFLKSSSFFPECNKYTYSMQILCCIYMYIISLIRPPPISYQLFSRYVGLGLTYSNKYCYKKRYWIIIYIPLFQTSDASRNRPLSPVLMLHPQSVTTPLTQPRCVMTASMLNTAGSRVGCVRVNIFYTVHRIMLVHVLKCLNRFFFNVCYCQ